MDEDFSCEDFVIFSDGVQKSIQDEVQKALHSPAENLYEAMYGFEVEVDLVPDSNGQNLYVHIKSRGKLKEIIVSSENWFINSVDCMPFESQRKLVTFLLEKAKSSEDGWTGTINGFVEVYSRVEYDRLVVQYGGAEFGVKLRQCFLTQ